MMTKMTVNHLDYVIINIVYVIIIIGSHQTPGTIALADSDSNARSDNAACLECEQRSEGVVQNQGYPRAIAQDDSGDHRFLDDQSSAIKASSGYIDSGFSGVSMLNGSEDAYSRSIYSSLLKILHNLRTIDQSKLRERADENLEAADSLDVRNRTEQGSAIDARPLQTYPDNIDPKHSYRTVNNGSRQAEKSNTSGTAWQKKPGQTPTVEPIAILEVMSEPLNGNSIGTEVNSATSKTSSQVKSMRTSFSSHQSPINKVSINRVDKKLNYLDQTVNTPSVAFSPIVDGSSLKSWRAAELKQINLLQPKEDQIDKPLFTMTSFDGNPDNQVSFSPFDDTNVVDDIQPYMREARDGKLVFQGSRSGSRARQQDEPEELIESSTVSTSRPRTRMQRQHTNYPGQHRHKASSASPQSQERSGPSLKISDFLTGKRDLSMLDHSDDGENIRKFSSLASDSYEGYTSQRPKLNINGIHLQQVYPAQQNYQQPQPAVYSLSNALGLGGFLNGQAQTTSGSSVQDFTSASQQRDLVNQPQTIQITAVPNVGLNNNPMVRINGINGQLPFNNALNNGINGFLDPFGRQVLMVNAERRQIDWSFWIWPLLVVAALPLVLGTLFVPVFLKTVVILIQLLQSLGLLLPITSALTQQLSQVTGVTTNQLDQVKN